MNDALVHTVQASLDGSWRHAARALEACQSDAWPEFVEATAPAAPILIGKQEFRKCLHVASSAFAGPRDGVLELLPVWVGDNPDEVPTSQWYAAHASSLDNESPAVMIPGSHDCDVDPRIDQYVVCRVQVWDVAYVVSTQWYSPEIKLLARYREYGVLGGRVLRVVDATATTGSAIPRPSLNIPPFSCWVEPRVDGLPSTLNQKIRELSITPDSEGNLIPRSCV